MRNITSKWNLPQRDIFFAIAVVSIILMLIIPLPAFVLDTLMSVSLMFGLVIMLLVIYLTKAADFSVFPTLLLISTVFRLAINVSSTRLILSQGSAFEGKIIRAFGSFVVGATGVGGYVIGAIIFIIIIAVQFIVITKGATRISEVAARFTLDAMPNKYMSIDADLSNGVINEQEAVDRRLFIQKEADFYGAMDGASKFIQGDVIVGLLITLINVVGGFIVGMTAHGESFNVALSTYVPLTIGDGLVAQIPALLISTATGVIVTRAVSDESLPKDLTRQFSFQPKIYFIAAGFLGLMAFLPGFPTIILLLLAVGSGFLGYFLSTQAQRLTQKEKDEEAKKKAVHKGPENITPLLKTDPLALDIGYELIPLVDQDRGAELLESITNIRRQSALDLGLVVPPIRIRDNMRLAPSEYVFKIRGVEVGRDKIRIGCFLAMDSGVARGELKGEKTIEPAFGLPATWIKDDQREEAENMGFTVVDAATIIATHLTELIKRHAEDILGRDEVNSIIESVKMDYPTVTDAALKVASLGLVQKVLQGLLKEGISIKNMVSILETVADYAETEKDPHQLVEYVRQSLKRQISLKYLDDENKLNVIRIEPELETEIANNIVQEFDGAYSIALPPDSMNRFINNIKSEIEKFAKSGIVPVILCGAKVRSIVKNTLLKYLPGVAVMSLSELLPDINIELLSTVGLGNEINASVD